MKKLIHNSVVGIIEHHIVNIPVTNEVTDHRMFYTVHLISVGVCRTVFVKLVHLLHRSLACLLSEAAREIEEYLRQEQSRGEQKRKRNDLE